MAVPKSEASELSLVSKVEMRIAIADTDSKLETLLNTYLAPLLLKLGSEHLSVRNKVIAVCQHINTRTASSALQLPVLALLKQFKSQHAPLVRHFDLVYVQQGFSRLSYAERLDLLPILLNGLASDAKTSSNQGAVLFNLFLQLVHHFKLPERGSLEDRNLRSTLSVDSEDLNFLCEKAASLMLLYVVAPGKNAGLSAADFEFLTLQSKHGVWDPSNDGLNLTNSKSALIRFLNSGLFVDEERFMPVLFASADPNSRISDQAEDTLKRTLSKVSLEERALVDRLFKVYFGDGDKSAVRTPLKIKIITLLNQSQCATRPTGEIKRLVEEAIGQSVGPNEVPLAQGRELGKLRAAVFSFINWVTRMGSSTDLAIIAPSTTYKLKEFIENQGWPTALPEKRSVEDLTQRGFAYESLGLLAKASPKELLFDPDIELVRFLFRSLSEDTSGENIAVSIDESLASVLGPFSSISDSAVLDSVRSLLLSQIKLKVGAESPSDSNARIQRSTQYASVRFSNRILPFHDVLARWIDLEALSNSRNEIVEEAKRGLDPYWFQTLSFDVISTDKARERPKLEFPDFFRYAELVLAKPSLDPKSTFTFRISGRVQNISLRHAVRFGRTLFLSTIDLIDSIDENFERELDRKTNTDADFRERLKVYLAESIQDQMKKQNLMLYVESAFDLLVADQSRKSITENDFFIEACALLGNTAVNHFSGRTDELKEGIWSNDNVTRLSSAKTFGILASHSSDRNQSRQSILQELKEMTKLWNKATGAQVNKTSGSMVALASLYARQFARTQNATVNSDQSDLVNLLIEILDTSNDKSFREAVAISVEQLALFGSLDPNSLSKDQASILVDQLSEDALKGQEKAIVAMSRLGMVCSEDSAGDTRLLDRLIEEIIGLHEIKQLETQFAVGEGLACLASGWESTSLISALDIEAATPTTKARHKTLETVLNKVVASTKNSGRSLRKASIIWLLCLIQYCGHLSAIQGRLQQLQNTFMTFLSDKDSLISEAASRGLSIIYEKSDKELQDKLVHSLLEAFTGSKSSLAGTVDKDSELFEPGALPTGEGSSVTSYKDIMSLAAEMGDPSLVYKFMSLAANNAIWSSRAALANFGLGKILTDTNTDTYLSQNPKLYVKLFRFRFDPNPNVQRSMTAIWSTLVKDQSATVDKYFNDIMQDLLKSILGKEWRSRQASCEAIADLVQGKKFDQYEQYLNEIWTVSFKVLDDIKDSVRQAAMKLCRVLTTILVRTVESGSSTSTTDAMLKRVLPFLESQLEASAEEVQIFALSTLLDLINKGKSKLRPFIPELVERLLALLSSLEPQAINYLHLNAAKYNLTEEKIDAQRLRSVSSSPMMDAIETCFDSLDESTMAQLVPRLESAIKEAVGMPSKVGCSRALVSLSTRRTFLFKPHAHRFIKIVMRHAVDRNETVSASYAIALGYLARLASDEALLEISSYAQKLYFNAEDTRSRLLAGDVISAMAKHATDRFMSLASEFLPFIFLAKHDTDEQPQQLFKEVWSDNAGGSRAISLYQKEILALSGQYLDSPKWALKHASALTIGEVASSCDDSWNGDHFRELHPFLERALAGKIWDGKAKVFEGFITYLVKMSKVLQSQDSLSTSTKKILLREAKRNNPAYRAEALLQLARLFKESTLSMPQETLELVSSLVEELKDADEAMDIDSGPSSTKSLLEATYANSMLALLRSVQPSEPGFREETQNSLAIAAAVSSGAGVKTQSAVCEGLESVLSQMQSDVSRWNSVEKQRKRQIEQALCSVLETFGDGPEDFRLKRATLLHRFGIGLDKANDEALVSRLERLRRQWSADERSPAVLDMLSR